MLTKIYTHFYRNMKNLVTNSKILRTEKKSLGTVYKTTNVDKITASLMRTVVQQMQQNRNLRILQI